MKMFGIVCALSAFSFVAAMPAIGHNCHRGHHWCDAWDCGAYPRQSATANRGLGVRGGAVALQTMEGMIAEVVYLPGVTEDSGLVEIRLQSSTQTRLIRLAPAGFLKDRGLLLREGDSVSVKGFAVNGMEGALLVATEVHKGDKTVSLRDESGQSAW
jgi:hypothetical protein